jgi:glycosyltransferase involved in cell wall biosynthesis
MTKITAIIPTFNEESNIQRALESVSFADEIIAVIFVIK